VTISRIAKTKQGRFSLFDENGDFLFSIDGETMVKNHVREGAALDAASLEALKEQSDTRKAKDKALGYLSLRDHASGELYDKLCRKFDARSAAAAVAEMQRLGLINDENFARHRAKYLADQNRSPREIRRRLAEKGILTSSCCPGFVGYVKKKYPQLDKYISHTPSPMVMIGLYLKEKEPDAKVIFIGPCVAKKKEFQLGRTMNAIDCVLTYEELYALFESKDIDLTQLEEAPLDEASPFGRNFARSGGVTQAVAQVMKEKGVDFDLKPVPCSGIAECEMALLKLKLGKLEGNFIEGMACDGGCVQGAGCLVRSPRNRMDVEKHAKQADGRTILQAVAASRGEQPKQEAAKTEAPKAEAKPAAKAPAKPEAAPAK